jgi:hypothetical protein
MIPWPESIRQSGVLALIGTGPETMPPLFLEIVEPSAAPAPGDHRACIRIVLIAGAQGVRSFLRYRS